MYVCIPTFRILVLKKVQDFIVHLQCMYVMGRLVGTVCQICHIFTFAGLGTKFSHKVLRALLQPCVAALALPFSTARGILRQYGYGSDSIDIQDEKFNFFFSSASVFISQSTTIAHKTSQNFIYLFFQRLHDEATTIKWLLLKKYDMI